MKKYVQGKIEKHVARIFTITPRTPGSKEILLFSRIVLPVLLLVLWINLRRNHITTIH